MIKEYNITGITCGGCATAVKNTLETLPEVKIADIQIDAPQGKLEFDTVVDTEVLNQKLSSVGSYTLSEVVKNVS